MWTVKEEVTEALKTLQLNARELIQYSAEESELIQRKAMSKYVEGNPRSWWESLKLKHEAFDYPFASDYIQKLMPEGEVDCYWIPETEEESLPVYKVRAKIISKIMELTPAFEYYVLGLDLDWLIIETDHGPLWVINE